MLAEESWDKDAPQMTQTVLRLVGREDADKQRALEAALAQIDRAFGKGSVMKLGDKGKIVEIEFGLHRLAGPGPGAGHRRPAQGAGGRDLRAGKLGQDHAGPARGGRGAEARRHRRLHRRRARAGSHLRPQAGRQSRRSAGLPAGHRRTGAGDHRHPGALGRGGHDRHRLGRGADAQGRDRGRDGRQPARPAGAADEPGAAQADRLDLQGRAPWSSSSTRSA